VSCGGTALLGCASAALRDGSKGLPAPHGPFFAMVSINASLSVVGWFSGCMAVLCQTGKPDGSHEYNKYIQNGKVVRFAPPSVPPLGCRGHCRGPRPLRSDVCTEARIHDRPYERCASPLGQQNRSDVEPQYRGEAHLSDAIPPGSPHVFIRISVLSLSEVPCRSLILFSMPSPDMLACFGSCLIARFRRYLACADCNASTVTGCQR
jgi:hypothetical protein